MNALEAKSDQESRKKCLGAEDIFNDDVGIMEILKENTENESSKAPKVINKDIKLPVLYT